MDLQNVPGFAPNCEVLGFFGIKGFKAKIKNPSLIYNNKKFIERGEFIFAKRDFDLKKKSNKPLSWLLF